MYARDSTRVENLEKLVYKARTEEADEVYRGNMRKALASEGELQARIKKLEEDKRALTVANGTFQASEKAAKTESSKPQRSNDLLEKRIVTVSERHEAEVSKLKEKNETLTQEISNLGACAKGEWDAFKAHVSKLETENSILAQQISDRDSTIQSRDADISELKRRDGLHTEEMDRLRETNSEIFEQERSLRKELEQAKEIIAASKAAPSPAPAPTPPPALQTSPVPSPFPRPTSQQQSSYPSPPMSGDRSSSASNGASVFGTSRPSSGQPSWTAMTPAPAQQYSDANAFTTPQASPPPLFGRGNPDNPRAFSEKDLNKDIPESDDDSTDRDEDMGDGGPFEDFDDVDSEAERVDDNDDVPMGDDEAEDTPRWVPTLGNHKMESTPLSRSAIHPEKFLELTRSWMQSCKSH
jgi:hypothetical protein